jgi:putative lipoprotein (rSAM/lipoprotein system)
MKATCHRTLFCIARAVSLLISSILGIFFGCENTVEVEYGMPHADFKVSGMVQSSDTHQPVKGISILLRDTLWTIEAVRDTTATDSLGKYSFSFMGMSSAGQNTWILQALDIDSGENGSFLPKDTIFSIPDSTLQGGHDRYQGHGEAVIDLKLDRNSN